MTGNIYERGDKVRYGQKQQYKCQDVVEKLSFNKNANVAVRCLELRDKYNIEVVVETGTYLGRTTKFLAKAFKKVFTIDVAEEYISHTKNELSDYANIEYICGNTLDVLGSVCEKIGGGQTVLFFLDAHGNYHSDLIYRGWREEPEEESFNECEKEKTAGSKYYPENFDINVCPAKQEIKIISEHFKNRCVIMVDDIYDPHVEGGHINFGGVRFEYDYLKHAIDECYTLGHKYYYMRGSGLGWIKSVLILEPAGF